MATDERVRGEIAQVIDAVNARLARPEQIKAFTILEHDVSQQRGELTPTAKVRCAAIYERYRDQIQALYGPSLNHAR